jgi:hypothetical protein
MFRTVDGVHIMTELTSEWPDEIVSELSGSPFSFSFGKENMRTSTAHQFLMKELRKGPGIFQYNEENIGVCRGRCSREPRLLPNYFLTPLLRLVPWSTSQATTSSVN